VQPLSQDLCRNFVEFAPDALILVDACGTILYANTHAHTLFGYESGKLNGLSIDRLIPEESRPSPAAHRNTYAQGLRSRKMGNGGKPLLGLRENGTRFPAEIRLAPIPAPDGFLTAAVVRDATESDKIMSMQAAARQSAEDANDAKGRLLAAASHDLRQPMQSLRLLNGALKRLVHDPSVIEVLDQEERALNTMSELLHALLNIAKLESGTLLPTVSDVSLTAVFWNLREQFASLAKLKNLDLEIAAVDVCVRTDPILLRELLQNLLANAVRYTDAGRVALRCLAGGPGVALIEVEDTGIGIPQEVQEKIFDDFFQAAPRGHTHRGGAGLGLGIVRRLSKALNIPVRIASTVGIGTRFTIEIPISEALSLSDHDQAASVKPPPCKGRRILLVEDDCSMREALKIYLQLDEHEVHTAASMAELEELLPTFEIPPDIVISDFQLGPSDRGSDAIEKIRHRFQLTLPAILLTGDTSAIPARLVNSAGIRVLNKPVDGEKLVAIVEELLHTRGVDGPAAGIAANRRSAVTGSAP
jgi:two-component system, sensor histidine kinase